MPLYVGDYLADTGHLTTEQHGAYLLLIMHYWKNGGLPTTEPELAAIVRLSERRWKSICLPIAKLFLSGWQHKRIDLELARAELISTKRQIAGMKGGRGNRGLNNWQITNGAGDKAIAKQMDGQSQSHKESLEARREEGSELAKVVKAKGWIS
jgi:uncharacterized protein YdaU (DUF1376 family)